MDNFVSPRIGDAFEFTELDLESNREGRLSTSQIGRIRRAALLRGLIGVVAMLGLSVLAYASAGGGDGTSADVYVFLFFIVVPAALVLAMTIGVSEIAITASVEKRSGQVHLRTAPNDYEPSLDPSLWLMRPRPGEPSMPPPPRPNTATLRMRTPRNIGLYSMIVGEQEFRLTEAQFKALAYSTYTVYYMPRLGNRIVAVESFTAEVDPFHLGTIAKGNLMPYSDEGDTLRG
jgi:hypothetical protein